MKNGRLSNVVVGLAATGSAATGLLSAVAALFPFLSGEFLAAGALLIAAALSFGLLSLAVFGR